jgi:hypothetical protein
MSHRVKYPRVVNNVVSKICERWARQSFRVLNEVTVIVVIVNQLARLLVSRHDGRLRGVQAPLRHDLLKDKTIQQSFRKGRLEGKERKPEKR